MLGLQVRVLPEEPKRVSYNGITLDFQSDDIGSIPITRSNFWLDYDVFYIYNNDYIIRYYSNNCCKIFSLIKKEYYAQ